jgi:hypothetical protein
MPDVFSTGFSKRQGNVSFIALHVYDFGFFQEI